MLRRPRKGVQVRFRSDAALWTSTRRPSRNYTPGRSANPDVRSRSGKSSTR
jgi:hypothetical protein